MDTQNFNAPPPARSSVPRAIDPTVTRRSVPTGTRTGPGGVTHANVRHTTRYTVIGNHLAQHRELSLTAIGLATHIQSLPSGARVDIKTLAARFSEGETRIASALRELEAYGYLSRTRERLPSGRIVTHTVSYNHPKGLHPTKPVPPGVPDSKSVPASAPRLPTSPPRPTPTPTPPPPAPAPAPTPEPTPPPESALAETPVPPPPSPPPPPAAPPPPRPNAPLPEPLTPDPDRHRSAAALLAALHRDDTRLLLGERDVHRLAPAVEAWLERGAAPEAVRRALAAGLPREPVRHPAALLAHRLTALIPPPPPPPAPRPHPFQTCDSCDRAFRAPAPGHCRDCRTGHALREAA
ncbi:helix-turn-helix domain-containing protein [Streptomyces fagopyri]|uniref:helix-turn-helix domain-containing protein n=1 Tax=Streptomyces fagopyri TaxID=2662397 RepID=UPI003717E25B